MTIRVPLALGALLMALAALAAPASAQSGVQTLHFKYGPVKIAPGQNTIEIDENQLKPPVDGFITGFRPNLTYKDGSVPRVDVIHLHHGVWLSNFKPLFAAGEEKTRVRGAARLRLALPDDGPVAHEPHDPQPHPDPDQGLHHLRPRLRPRHVAARGEHAGDPDGLDGRRGRRLSRVRRQARPAWRRPPADLPGRGARRPAPEHVDRPGGRRARRHRGPPAPGRAVDGPEAHAGRPHRAAVPLEGEVLRARRARSRGTSR